MKLLMFGSTGQLACEMRELAQRGALDLVALDRVQADLSVPGAARSALRTAERPDAVLVAAAHTAVDRCEQEEDLADRVNHRAVGEIGAEAARMGVPVVHLSTDYVFDGSKPEPYGEDDATGPLNVYGRTKLAGERALAAAQPDHAILRTSWLFGRHGRNFVATMLRLACARDHVSVVDDQTGRPTATAHLAMAVLTVAGNLVANREPRLRGVFHVADEYATTWHGFAAAIFEELQRQGGKAPRLAAIATRDFPTPARRPANSVLDTSRIAAVHGVRPALWRADLPAVIAALRAGKACS